MPENVFNENVDYLITALKEVEKRDAIDRKSVV